MTSELTSTFLLGVVGGMALMLLLGVTAGAVLFALGACGGPECGRCGGGDS